MNAQVHHWPGKKGRETRSNLHHSGGSSMMLIRRQQRMKGSWTSEAVHACVEKKKNT